MSNNANMDYGAVKIVNINSNEVAKLMGICDKSFKLPSFDHVCTKDPTKRLSNLIQPEHSFKAVVGSKMAGFYFLSDKEQISDFQNFLSKNAPDVVSKLKFENKKLLKKLSTLKGIQGVAVGVLKEFRGKGIGKKLIEKPRQLGYDYVWGIQTRGLSDIDAWLKRRQVLVNYGDHFYITVEIF